VNALATSSSQARGCEREEEPDAKRRCGSSTEFASLGAGKADGEGPAADVQTRDETNGGDVLASAEVAPSTNLKRARNVSDHAKDYIFV
jgi:hypothetical protein